MPIGISAPELGREPRACMDYLAHRTAQAPMQFPSRMPPTRTALPARFATLLAVLFLALAGLGPARAQGGSSEAIDALPVLPQAGELALVTE